MIFRGCALPSSAAPTGEFYSHRTPNGHPVKVRDLKTVGREFNIFICSVFTGGGATPISPDRGGRLVSIFGLSLLLLCRSHSRDMKAQSLRRLCPCKPPLRRVPLKPVARVPLTGCRKAIHKDINLTASPGPERPGSVAVGREPAPPPRIWATSVRGCARRPGGVLPEGPVPGLWTGRREGAPRLAREA